MSIIKSCGDVLSSNTNFRVVKRKYKNLRLIIIELTGFGEETGCIFKPNLILKEYGKNPNARTCNLLFSLLITFIPNSCFLRLKSLDQ